MKSYLFLAGLVVTLGAQAAVRFVAPDGADSNPGTESEPLLTVQKGADLAMPGDSVVVKPGTYAEKVLSKRNGQPSSPITFRASGAAVVGGFELSHSNIVIDGFEIVGFVGTAARGAGVRINAPAHGTVVVNNNIHDLPPAFFGIQFTPASGLLPEDSAQGCIIRGNRIYKSGNHMLVLYGKSHLVESNRFDTTFGHDAIRCFGASHIIRKNYFTALNLGEGGHPDIIQTFGNPGFPSYDILIEGNTAVDCGSQICQLEQNEVPDIRDWTFRNNLFIRMAAQANIDIPGVKFHNNLFYQCTRNTAHVLSFVYYDPAVAGNRGQAYRGEVFNNIFFECGVDPTSNDKGWYVADDALTDFKADHNFVAGSGGAAKASGSVRDRFVLAEEHGINGGDPAFVNAAAGDFRLTPSSVLVDAGKLLTLPTSDILGALRIQGSGVDIGPHEAQTGSSSAISRPGNFRELN